MFTGTDRFPKQAIIDGLFAKNQGSTPRECMKNVPEIDAKS